MTNPLNPGSMPVDAESNPLYDRRANDGLTQLVAVMIEKMDVLASNVEDLTGAQTLANRFEDSQQEISMRSIEALNEARAAQLNIKENKELATKTQFLQRIVIAVLFVIFFGGGYVGIVQHNDISSNRKAQERSETAIKAAAVNAQILLNDQLARAEAASVSCQQRNTVSLNTFSFLIQAGNDVPALKDDVAKLLSQPGMKNLPDCSIYDKQAAQLRLKGAKEEN